MKTNSFSANSIGGRGGLFDSGAQAIRDALLAYFQSKRAERQDMRQLKRDERINERDQTNQAVELARRTGVRPDASQLGWTSPDRINPLLDASVRKYTQDEEQAGQARAIGDLRMQEYRRKLAESGMTIPGMTADENGAFDRGLNKRIEDGQAEPTILPNVEADPYGRGPSEDPRWMAQAAALKRREDAAAAAGEGARLKMDLLKSEIEKNSRVPEPKPIDRSWRQGDMGFMSRDLGEGFTASRDPAGAVTIVGPTGETLTPEKYQAMRASLGQAVGVGQPGVDINGPTATSGGVPEEISVAAAANALPAPSADVLQRNVSADYDSVNRRGLTGAVTPQEVRAVAERARMRKGIPTQHAQANIRPTDTEAELVAAYMSVHGGTPDAARAALQAAGVLQ